MTAARVALIGLLATGAGGCLLFTDTVNAPPEIKNPRARRAPPRGGGDVFDGGDRRDPGRAHVRVVCRPHLPAGPVVGGALAHAQAGDGARRTGRPYGLRQIPARRPGGVLPRGDRHRRRGSPRVGGHAGEDHRPRAAAQRPTPGAQRAARHLHRGIFHRAGRRRPLALLVGHGPGRALRGRRAGGPHRRRPRSGAPTFSSSGPSAPPSALRSSPGTNSGSIGW